MDDSLSMFTITKDGTPVLFQQSKEVKSLAQQFCSHWSRNDYAKCGAALKKIQKSTTAVTFTAICHELDIPSWKYADYYMDLYRTTRRGNSSDWTQRVCAKCEKPLPDEKMFRKIIVSCLKKGDIRFRIILGVEQERVRKRAPCCLCKHQIIPRLSSVRQQRSRAKRMMAFVARFAPDKWKSKRVLLKRGDKPKDKSPQKSLQRQLANEDLFLWDREVYGVYDSSGTPHPLEDVLDTPLIRDILSRLPRSLPKMHRLLSQIATDESLVTAALGSKQPPLEPVEMSPDLERLWRKRLDEE